MEGSGVMNKMESSGGPKIYDSIASVALSNMRRRSTLVNVPRHALTPTRRREPRTAPTSQTTIAVCTRPSALWILCQDMAESAWMTAAGLGDPKTKRGYAEPTHHESPEERVSSIYLCSISSCVAPGGLVGSREPHSEPSAVTSDCCTDTATDECQYVGFVRRTVEEVSGCMQLPA